MLNYIWAFMIVIGVIYGVATGTIEQVGNGAIESAEEAVKLCVTMLGIMSMWMGFMEVAEKSGLVAKAEKLLPIFWDWVGRQPPQDLKQWRNWQRSRYRKKGNFCQVISPPMRCAPF